MGRFGRGSRSSPAARQAAEREKEKEERQRRERSGGGGFRFFPSMGFHVPLFGGGDGGMGGWGGGWGGFGGGFSLRPVLTPTAAVGMLVVWWVIRML